MDNKFKNMPFNELKKLALGKQNEANIGTTTEAGFALIERLASSNDLDELKVNFKELLKMAEKEREYKKLHYIVSDKAGEAAREIVERIQLLENSKEYKQKTKENAIQLAEIRKEKFLEQQEINKNKN